MQSIGRTILALTAMLLAIVAGSGTAFAGPKPLPASGGQVITREGTTGGGSASVGGFLDSWPEVTLAVLVAVAVLAIAAAGLSRLHQHAPTTA